MRSPRMPMLMLLLGGIALGIPVPSLSDDTEARKELQAIYAEYVQSFLAKDTGPLRLWYERHLAADVIEIGTQNQRQNRQQVLDQVRRAQKVWPLAKES